MTDSNKKNGNDPNLQGTLCDNNHDINGKHVPQWNPLLDSLQDDHLYHLALGRRTHNLEEMFGDVRFICVGGTSKRMKSFAYFMKDQLGIRLPTGVALEDISQKGNRYSMYKIGPVLSVTHGMGASSLSILLHELLKLVRYAKCVDPVFLRLGTSGGIGVEPGSVIITSKGVDGLLRPVYELPILGKLEKFPVVFDQKLVQELVSIGKTNFSHFKTYSGATMCTQDFYEGQARLDGAFCHYTAQDKADFLKLLKESGVVNIEMESVTFGAMCHAAGVPAAIICVTLLDRLRGDQIDIPPDQYDELQHRSRLVAAEFIKTRLARINGSQHIFKSHWRRSALPKSPNWSSPNKVDGTTLSNASEEISSILWNSSGSVDAAICPSPSSLSSWPCFRTLRRE